MNQKQIVIKKLRILDVGQGFTGREAHQTLLDLGVDMPLRSVRRAMHDLTKENRMMKTANRRKWGPGNGETETIYRVIK